MNVEIIDASDNPEEQVCKAARNDYRSDGVIGHSLEEVMEDVKVDEGHLKDLHKQTFTLSYMAQPPESPTRGHVETKDGEWFWAERSRLITEAKKRTLIDTLIGGTSGHWGPFEHPKATVAIEGVTRVLMAQLTRHRHATFDVMSLRYVGLDDGFETTDSGHLAKTTDEGRSLRGAVTDRFQVPEFRGEDYEVTRDEGVSEFDPERVENTYVKAYKDAVEHYLRLLDEGVPQEQARKVLPMGTKVNIVVTMNARAWMHVLQVREKANVQGETRRCAEAIHDALSEWMPYTFQVYDGKNLGGLAP